jgi:HlyD family secretion protein
MNTIPMTIISFLKKGAQLLGTYLIPVIAVVGFFTALSVVRAGNKPPPTSAPIIEPAIAPFEYYVAGAGLVESSGENIAISAQVPGVIENIFVAVGQKVKKDEPLFQIDTKAAKALVETRLASVEVSKAQSTDAKNQLDFITSLSDKRAVSVEELTKRKNAYAISQAKLQLAEKELEAAKTDLERLIVRAPRDGTALRINTRPGEFAAAQNIAAPLLIFGNIEQLWVRVDIDENDAWRVKENAKAVGSLRGNASMKTDLEFVRFEPYVIPKKSLTGDNSERVDTRVLQVIYSFNPKTLPVFVGQLMDIYIEGERNG